MRLEDGLYATSLVPDGEGEKGHEVAWLPRELKFHWGRSAGKRVCLALVVPDGLQICIP